MNPLTNVKNITKLSERELKSNDGKTSWHDEYRESAWVFIGGLPFDLSEGDIIAIFSQYGDPVNLNLVRDKGTGKSRGFAFLCYEDQRSTILAVDNFNGIKILGRTIRVDHVKDYKPPKDSDKLDDITRKLHITGCAHGVELPGLPPPSITKNTKYDRIEDKTIPDDRLLPFPPSDERERRQALPDSSSDQPASRKKESSKHLKKKDAKSKKSKKDKKKKSKKKSSKKHKRKYESSGSSSSGESSESSSAESEDDEPRRKKKRR